MTPSSPDPGASDLVSDAMRAAPLGAAAMLARGLLSTERLSWGWVIRSSIAAGVVSFFAGQAVKDYITSQGLQDVCVGLAGLATPEIVDAAIRFVKAKAQAKVQEAEANLKKRRGKPQSKARR